MKRILGIDLGTSSIGWAIVERDDESSILTEKGVSIFKEGVMREKGIEKSPVQDRTAARGLRRNYFRRRLRKICLLKVLVKHGLCPFLSDEQLKKWQQNKIYPLTDEFLNWQRTDDNTDRNPYHDRYIALTEKIDLDSMEGRYILGRALYHLSQRRGFLSNRKEEGKDAENGKVKTGINNLNDEIEAAGCKYLGEYFYRLYQNKDKIRTRYTSRKEHYLAEFNAICNMQELPEQLRKEIGSIIFFQRPLKSQKGTIGKCPFERGKQRCSVSHPRFEEFRMLQFINSIRITAPGDTEPRPLSKQEIERIMPLFYPKTKKRSKVKQNFEFKEIAKKIAGKNGYSCAGENKGNTAYSFNYAEYSTVSGCPVTASLMSIFGDNWLNEICSLYTLAGKGGKTGTIKTEEEILNDIWHALYFFDDEEKLCAWAKEKLQLNDEDAESFASISLKRDFAALSLKAINKMLPYMRRGYRYDEAVFMANLKRVLPPATRNNEILFNEIEQGVAAIVADYKNNPLNKEKSKMQCVSEYLRDIDSNNSFCIDRLYHPSMIKMYRDVETDNGEIPQLGSPMTNAIRNPMAMRALFRLRALVNRLLKEGKIDKDTQINIEFARELNDKNRRKAIEEFQREREKENREYAEKIKEYFLAETGKETEPSERDILKYRLWEEQEHVCIYTGKQIGLADFLGSNASFDIEHTVPRSRNGESDMSNLTLCSSRFNREIKRTKMPSELGNYDEIISRVESLGWKEKTESLKRDIERYSQRSKAANTKEDKDRAITARHKAKLNLEYWQKKYKSFTMLEAPKEFRNRQGIDICVISKYAKAFLGTIFKTIKTVKGATTAEFRKMWGLQEEYTKKERVNHLHHCIDAITIACIGDAEYRKWAEFVTDEERYKYGEGNGNKPRFDKPWENFTEDIKALTDEVLVSHYTPDNMPKQSRKAVRLRSKYKLNKKGDRIFMQGDTARGILHQETFYGSIAHKSEIRYVIRKAISSLETSDIDKIVDDVVREKVKAAVEEVGFKKAIDPTSYTIWMNEEKRIPIKKVRIFVPSVKQAIKLKKQRDLSEKEYKQYYSVKNDTNYCMAIYEGFDKKGKEKRTFRLISNIEAAEFLKRSRLKEKSERLVPETDENGYRLKYILKAGTMVLFYEKSADELKLCTSKDLVRRLYKVTGLSSSIIGNEYYYGTIELRHHQEARPKGELKCKNGVWSKDEEYRPIIGLLHSQIKALVEGYDFTIDITGKIKFKN